MAVKPVRITWRLILTVIVLAASYYFLTGTVIQRLPWALVPTWWSRMWPSRSTAVLSWFDLLNLAGALIASLPIAIVIRFLVRQYQYGVALIVATTVAGVVLISGYINYPPHPDNASSWWLSSVVLFMVLGGAPPFVVWLCRLAPSNLRWSGQDEHLRSTKEQVDD
jgi:hypothetical protein